MVEKSNGGIAEEIRAATSEVDYAADHAQLRALENTFRSLEANILLARSQFMRQAGITFDGARDTYQVLGYARNLTSKDYYDRYSRGGIAGRIIDAMPDACWRGSMELVEDENLEDMTEFEQAWHDLDQKHQIQPKLLRVDKLGRLSTYSVLLIGAVGDMDQELPKAKGSEALLYLTPFLGGGGPGGSANERMVAVDGDCSIATYDIDTASPRFGLPETYNLKRTDMVAPLLMKPVHWSRVVHVAEGLLRDEVYGLPALERVWNLLDDLDKITGGGSEAFWLRANQGMHIDIDKDMALDATKDTIASLKDQAENYKHQLTRWLRTRGTTVTPLGSDVANFGPSADAVLTQIAGSKAMPKRILTGSEMGELASSQDRDNWKDQVNGRQTSYVGPYIVRPLVDRLIAYGYLPEPKGGADAYEVRWPHIQTLTEEEKATGAQKWAATNQTQGEVVFTDAEIRDKWYGMVPLTDAQRKEMADRAAEKLAQQQEAMAATAAPQLLDAAPTDGAQALKAAGGVGSGIPGHVTDKPAYVAATKTLNQILGGPKASAAVRKKATIDTIRRVKTEDLHRLVATYESLEKAGGGKSFALDRIKSELKLRTAEVDEDNELIRVLAEAIECGNLDVVAQIVGLQHSYGTTQIQLPDDVAAKVIAFGQSIPDADLYEPKRRETDIHVTVKYGLIKPDAMLLSQVVVKRGPFTPLLSKVGRITLTLGKVSVFQNPDYDVVIVRVESKDLVDLNRAISSGVECAPSDHVGYVPHVTIAHVMPGLGEQYVGRTDFDGSVVSVDAITMSDADDVRSEVSLVGNGFKVLGDAPGHEFHGNQFTAGGAASFSGKSADGKVEGTMQVKVIDPHSNRDKVTRTETKGKRTRMYEGASVHIPTATVETDRSKRGLEPLRFEAHHHTLKVVK